MNLLVRLFPKAAALAERNREIERLKSELEIYKAANRDLHQATIAHSETIRLERERAERAESETKSLRAKLRAQNEADLLLVSTQIVRRITNGEQLTEKDEAVLRQRALLRAQSQFNSQMQQASPFAQFCNAMGQQAAQAFNHAH